MKIRYLIILFLFVLISCGEKINQVDNKELTNKTDDTKALLQGAWFGEEYDEHAVFFINGDSINYIEHFNRSKYLISNDTFEIFTKTVHIKQLILKLSKDSLIIKNLASLEISKYWKLAATIDNKHEQLAKDFFEKFIAKQDYNLDQLNKITFFDIDKDSIKEVVFEYSATSKKYQNRWEAYIVVLKNSNNSYNVVAHEKIGGKGYRDITLQKILPEGVFLFNTKKLGPNDAMCCPSVKSTTKYKLKSNKFIEID